MMTREYTIEKKNPKSFFSRENINEETNFFNICVTMEKKRRGSSLTFIN